CSISAPATRSRTPTTPISSISSTGCSSTPSSNGPAISISNHAANRARCASHRRCAAQCLSVPAPG
ncbi:Type II secretory pathway, ATPase PulE/Tfp pilus assembly pathway, ATPase PilB, partial [Pseudomonas sp. FEN]